MDFGGIAAFSGLELGFGGFFGFGTWMGCDAGVGEGSDLRCIGTKSRNLSVLGRDLSGYFLAASSMTSS